MQSLVSAPLIETLHAEMLRRSTALIDAGFDPHLAIVQVGHDPATDMYIGIKQRVAKELRIIISHYTNELSAPQSELTELLAFLENDPDVLASILQLPLPRGYDTESFISLIPESKDVDGLRGDWMNLDVVPELDEILDGSYTGPFLPPMLLSVLSLLAQYHVSPADHHTVLIGSGKLVGEPLYHYFAKQGWSVDTVDEESSDIIERSRRATLLITGTGEKNLVTYQWVQDKAIVLNAADDVHIDSVSQIASAMSPAKGGLGPLTVSWLLHNVLTACERSFNA